MKDLWENPYPRWSLRHWIYRIKRPGHDSHRMFWGWGMERYHTHSIYWVGVITIWWHEDTGWEWSWNFD